VSNVLIGIIGVILFIALAMAGAMFLGPQFQRAFVNSKAMTLSQMASQINMALSMRRTDAGIPFVARASVLGLQQAGYLKSLPVNPYVGEGGFPFRVLYSGDLGSPLYYADVVFVSLGHSEDVEEVCTAINRQTTGNEFIPVMPIENGSSVHSMITRPTGCFKMHSNGISGEANPGDFVLYSKI
jgi:hypothetical protein